MAKLPNLTEELKAAPAGINSGIPISNIEVSPVNEATAKLGGELTKAGEEIVKTDDHIQRFNYALNKSRLVREHANLINQAEQDINNTGDYTYTQANYTKKLGQLQSDLGKDLTNPSYKAKFDEEAAELQNNTSLKINQLQQKAQQAHSYALANDELNNTVESVMKTQDPVLQERIIKAGLAPIVAAIPNSDPDKDLKIQKVEQEYKKRVGVGVFNSLSPTEQIQSLKNYDQDHKKFSTVSYIDAEDRPLYMQRAQQALEQQKNQTIANIRDGDFLKKRNAENNALDVVVKGGNVANIPIAQYALLDESTRNNLNKIQQINNGTLQRDPVAGIQAYNKYSDLYTDDPKAFAKIDPITIQSEVSPDKVDEVMKWHQAAAQGIPQNKQESAFNQTANYYVKNIIKKKPNSEDAALFIDKFRQAKDDFIEAKGKQPTLEELRYIGNGLVSQVAVSGSFYGTNDKKVYKLTGKEEAPEDAKNEILKQAQTINSDIVLTPEQINQIYFKQNQQNSIK